MGADEIEFDLWQTKDGVIVSCHDPDVKGGEKGNRIIDLLDEPNNPILSASSSFFKAESFKDYRFDEDLVNLDEERARLNKELEQVKKRLAQSEGKLNNQGFVAKAPEAVIEKVKGQAEKEREQIALIEAAINALK